jgi:hypothetical protein
MIEFTSEPRHELDGLLTGIHLDPLRVISIVGKSPVDKFPVGKSPPSLVEFPYMWE